VAVEPDAPGGNEIVVTGSVASGTRVLVVNVVTTPFEPVDVMTVICSLNEVMNEVLSSPDRAAVLIALLQKRCFRLIP
jgi:hypothetical protein